MGFVPSIWDTDWVRASLPPVPRRREVARPTGIAGSILIEAEANMVWMCIWVFVSRLHPLSLPSVNQFSLGGGFFCLLYYLPIYFQAVLEVSAEQSGVRTLAIIVSESERIMKPLRADGR